MGRLLEAAVRHFDDAGWSYEHDAYIDLYRLRVMAQHAAYDCSAWEHGNTLAFYVVLPEHVPAERRPAVAELITRFNHQILFGNFEMDYGDGEVRFRTSVDVGNGPLPASEIGPLVQVGLRTMDQHLRAFQLVLHEDMPPAEAMRRVDHGRASPGGSRAGVGGRPAFRAA